MAFKLISPKNEGKFVGSNRMSFFGGLHPVSHPNGQGDAEMQRKAAAKKIGEIGGGEDPLHIGPRADAYQ